MTTLNDTRPLPAQGTINTSPIALDEHLDGELDAIWAAVEPETRARGNDIHLPISLSFARRRLDTCRSFAMGRTELSFTWAELGLDPRTPVFLLNPLIAWTGP